MPFGLRVMVGGWTSFLIGLFRRFAFVFDLFVRWRLCVLSFYWWLVCSSITVIYIVGGGCVITLFADG